MGQAEFGTELIAAACHFPITVEITGTLTDQHLEQLAIVTEKAVAERIAAAQREVGSMSGGHDRVLALFAGDAAGAPVKATPGTRHGRRVPTTHSRTRADTVKASQKTKTKPIRPAAATAAGARKPVTGTAASGPLFHVDWTWVVKLGLLPRGTKIPAAEAKRDENLIWAGDELSIFAHVSLPGAKSLGLKTISMTGGLTGHRGDAVVSSGHWINDTTIGWDIVATTPGRRSMSFFVVSPDGAQEYQHDIDLTVAADAQLFKDRCSTAGQLLATADKKAREWFMNCFLAYKAGYENQSAAIEAQRGAEKLAGQLLLGVLFGVVGGAVGGWVSKTASIQNAAKYFKNEFGDKAEAAFTDATKDLAKYTARLPATFATPGKIPAGGAGGSTDPAAAGIGGQGADAVAALDPLNWMATIDAKIAGEEAAMGQWILNAHLLADQISVTHPDYIFDWDPVEVVRASATIDGKPIDDLGPIPTALEYERACWEVWLSCYAYTVRYTHGDVPFGSFYSVSSDVGKKIRDRIDTVARKFGETGDEWIQRYGEPSRLKAEAEKARLDD